MWACTKADGKTELVSFQKIVKKRPKRYRQSTYRQPLFDFGGEAPFGRNWVALEGKSVSQWKKRGHPWGVDVFTISPFGLGSHFLWLISGESESWVCLFCDLEFLSVINQIPCDQGGMPKHVMDVWEEKIYTKLKVLSFEKAWDEIERDRFTIGNFRNGTNVEKFINRHILVASKASYWLNVEIPNKKSVLFVLEFFWWTVSCNSEQM